jgi:hypothetical protein
MPEHQRFKLFAFLAPCLELVNRLIFAYRVVAELHASGENGPTPGIESAAAFKLLRWACIRGHNGLQVGVPLVGNRFHD